MTFPSTNWMSDPLFAAALRGDVLGVQDVKDALNSCGIADLNFTSLVIATGPRQEKTAVVSLSVVNTDGSARTFAKLKELARAHHETARMCRNKGLTKFRSHTTRSILHFYANASEAPEIRRKVHEFQSKVELIFASSLPAKSLWEDETSARMMHLETEMNRKVLEINDLAALISKRHLTNIAVFEQTINWQLTFVRANRKYQTSTDAQLSQFFDANQKAVEAFLTECARSGKVCELLIGQSRRPNRNTFRGHSTTLFAIPMKRLNASFFNVREVIVVFDASSESQTTHYRLDAIQELIDRFLFLKYQSGRSTFVTSLFTHQRILLGTAYSTYKHLESEADELIVRKVCPSLINLTKAHSVAFLKYDPWKNCLYRQKPPH
jgi:hypothetical protein